MHEPPEATEEEQEQATGPRGAEEESMRYPDHDTGQEPADEPADDDA